MHVKIDRNSRIGRWYFDWYDRNLEDEPRIVTECHIRKILIYQFLYWFRKYKILGTRIRPYMLSIVGFFTLTSAIAPELVLWFIVIPIFSVVSTLFVVLVFEICIKSAQHTALGNLLNRISDKLEGPVAKLIDLLKSAHYMLWSIRVFGRRIAWVVITAAISFFQVWIYLWYLSTRNPIAAIIFVLMASIEVLIVTIFVLGVIWAFFEEYDPINRVRKSKRPTGSYQQISTSEQKPRGIYKLLIEVGICRYVDWYVS